MDLILENFYFVVVKQQQVIYTAEFQMKIIIIFYTCSLIRFG